MSASRKLETVTVFDPAGGGPMNINKDDFDRQPGKFKLFREKGIADLNVEELRALADEKGIDHSKMKKADLIAALS